jgi:hypothetical protein
MHSHEGQTALENSKFNPLNEKEKQLRLKEEELGKKEEELSDQLCSVEEQEVKLSLNPKIS